jgi:DNA-binding NarL/FixJ family response regulator
LPREAWQEGWAFSDKVRDHPLGVHVAHPKSAVRMVWRNAVVASSLELLGTSSTVPDALAQCRSQRPDVLVVAVGLHDAHQLVRIAVDEFGCAVLVLAEHYSVLGFLSLVGAGATGYLCETHSAEAMQAAIRGVAGEHPVMSDQMIRCLLDAHRLSDRLRELRAKGPLSRLSPREWEVLQLMRSGASTAQIANRLVVSPTTVRGYISVIVRVLGARDRAEAVQLADRLMAGPSQTASDASPVAPHSDSG